MCQNDQAHLVHVVHFVWVPRWGAELKLQRLHVLEQPRLRVQNCQPQIKNFCGFLLICFSSMFWCVFSRAFSMVQYDSDWFSAFWCKTWNSWFFHVLACSFYLLWNEWHCKSWHLTLRLHCDRGCNIFFKLSICLALRAASQAFFASLSWLA